MRQEPTSVRTARLILTWSEDNVAVPCVSDGVERVGCLSRPGIVVHAHPAEVTSETRLHELTSSRIEQLTRGVEDVMNNRRHCQSEIPVFLFKGAEGSRREGWVGLRLALEVARHSRLHLMRRSVQGRIFTPFLRSAARPSSTGEPGSSHIRSHDVGGLGQQSASSCPRC